MEKILCILLIVIHFTVGTIFWIIDRKGSLDKIQKNVTVSDDEYSAIFRRSTLNFLTIVLPLVFLSLSVPRYRGLVPTGPITFISSLILLITLADFISYWIHRAMHIPFMFNNFHYHHHELVSPVAYGTLDAHPVEVVLWDFLPIMAPIHILGASDSLTITFSCISFFSSILAHSGYLTFLNDAMHDLHHERRKCNYGSFFSDSLFGTYIEREKGREYPRFDQETKNLEGSRNIWLKSQDADN